MRGFFGRGVYNGVETQPGGGEDVQEQEMIAQLLQQDERGMEALLLHYGPLMRYIIAPILPDPQDREECLSEASLRVWNKIAQFDAARGSWSAWLTAVTRNTALNFQRSAARHGDTAGGRAVAGGIPGGGADTSRAPRRAARCARTARSERPGAVLPKVLLLTVHRTDRVRAGHDGPGRRGQALSPEKAAAQNVGR